MNIAAAKAVANKLPLPSFEIANTQDHYTSTVYDIARSMVSNLNEVATINAREVLALTESFWKARYHTVFPPKNLMICPGDCVSNFMGFGTQLPQGVIEDIKCGGEDLVRQLNGFNFVLGDLTGDAVTQSGAQNESQAVPGIVETAAE